MTTTNAMPTILIVDDSMLDLRLIGGLLSRGDTYRLLYAEDGRQALQTVELQQPDLVITDLIMPEMDGLELVCRMRVEHPDVPVILMTAYGNETTAVEALEQGAASYVPKARQAERLVETVRRVLARSRADRSQQRMMGCLAQLDCSFMLDNDPDLIPPLVDLIQQMLTGMPHGDPTARMRIGLAVEEALLNALYHGSLELSEADLAEARASMSEMALAELVAARRQEPGYRDRRIFFQAQISTSGARFIIRDPGPGFDRQRSVARTSSERFETGRGRGTTLMQVFMDEVVYNEAGNEVQMYKRRLAGASPNVAI